MSKQEASESLSDREGSRAIAEPGAGQDDVSSRRLLLCEVLLEEYESLREPPSDKTKIDQIELDDLENIWGEIHDYLRTIESERDPEEKFNGDMVSRIYNFM